MNSLRQNLLEVIKPVSQTTLKNVVVFVHFIIQYKNLKIEVNFHASYFFFGELKDQLLSMGGGGGKGQRILFLEGGGGGISRLQQNFKGDFRSFTANGGGGGGVRGLKNNTDLMRRSGKFYYDKTKIFRPLSP